MNTESPILFLPRLDATAKLLVLLAREDLGTEGPQLVCRLAREVPDWHEFVKLAVANFALPFVHLHIAHLVAGGAPADLAEDIKVVATRAAMANLKAQSGLVAFHRQCVSPVHAAHVYLKGPALAVRYYQNPALRICRDIDLLVGQRDMVAVGKRAVAHGYRLLLDENQVVFAEDSQDIDFILRHCDVLSMLSPDSIHFEIHRRIEKLTPIFAVNRVLATAEPLALGNCIVKTVSTDWLFCYIAYHHSRHFWSRLHWVADLHAIISHSSFDRDRVLALASRIGLANTVQATLDFAALTSQPDAWSEGTFSSHGGRFLEACLRGLPGDSRYEFESWAGMFLFDFGNPWQVDPGWKGSFWGGSALRRLKPNLQQYLSNPRPRSREFLYYLENAVTLSRNALLHLKAR